MNLVEAECRGKKWEPTC